MSLHRLLGRFLPKLGGAQQAPPSFLPGIISMLLLSLPELPLDAPEPVLRSVAPQDVLTAAQASLPGSLLHSGMPLQSVSAEKGHQNEVIDQWLAAFWPRALRPSTVLSAAVTAGSP
jgi:hypothetical protein